MVVATTSAYFFSARQAKQYAGERLAHLREERRRRQPAERGLHRHLRARPRDGRHQRHPRQPGHAGARRRPSSRRRASTTPPATPCPPARRRARQRQRNSGSNVVLITGDSEDPELAAAAANAYADAFVDWRKERQQAQIQKAVDAVEAQLDEYEGAAKQTADYLMLKQRLQDLVISKATATGNYRVLVQAQVPTAPYAPDPWRAAILGLGVGLFAGIGLAFLLEQFDTRLRTHRRDRRTRCACPSSGASRASRARRSTRTSWSRSRTRTGTPPRRSAWCAPTSTSSTSTPSISSLVVTSCVQGEGKSVAVANLAVVHGAGRQEGHRRRRRPAAPAPAQVLRPAQRGRPQHRGHRPDQPGAVAAGGRGRRRGAGRGARADFADWARGTDTLRTSTCSPAGRCRPTRARSSPRGASPPPSSACSARPTCVIVDSPAMLPVGDTSAIARSVDGLVFLVDMHLRQAPAARRRPPTSCAACPAACSAPWCAWRAAACTARTTSRTTTRPHTPATATVSDAGRRARRSPTPRRASSRGRSPASRPRGRSSSVRASPADYRTRPGGPTGSVSGVPVLRAG